MIMMKKNAATHLAHHIISRTSRCFTIALATHTHTHTHSHTQTLTHTNTHTHTHTYFTDDRGKDEKIVKRQKN